MYAVFLLDALTRYPTGYDALHYHLPQAVSWMHHRALDLTFGVTHLSLPENGTITLLLLSFAK